jgi:heat-inducible transcriptional repressor
MKNETTLTAREVEVLHAAVRAYIEAGEPVASRTLARRRRDGLSAASIRNVLADLADKGYLSQPHTSAGRIPTGKAFRHYVGSVSASRMTPSEVEKLRAELNVESLEQRVERSSHVLTELTHHVGIAAAIPASRQTLDQIELLSLSEGRILMIVVTRDGAVSNRVVQLDESLSQTELNSIRNYVNLHFGGWVLADARQELARRLVEASAAYDAILKRLIILYTKGLLDLELSPEVHMEGVSTLVGLELNLTREKTRELFRTLEEKKRLLSLLDQFLEQPNGEMSVQVGLGDVHPFMSEFSLIGISLELPSGVQARIAVIGPMRMQYEKTMSAVLHVGRIFQTLPS